MPNICSTEYRFRGSKNEIDMLADDMLAVQNNTCRTEYERTWCVYLATDLLGLCEDEVKGMYVSSQDEIPFCEDFWGSKPLQKWAM